MSLSHKREAEEIKAVKVLPLFWLHYNPKPEHSMDKPHENILKL
tara:strand:+ start:193 stop:324 length:132 start_codon:yes stop_codon:yes gene_type:complete